LKLQLSASKWILPKLQPTAKSTRDTGNTNTLQTTNLLFAGTRNEEEHAQMPPPQDDFRLGLPNNRTACRFPILLPGVKCYTDASIIPDTVNSNPRKAGIGIFILDPAHQSKFLIKAQINQITSVIMAEAASLTLAASIISLLHTNDTSLLTDSQLLVNFFNGNDLSSPPHWDIKPFTQRFLNAVTSRRVQVIKIARSSNITAHSLATQALRHSDDQCNLFRTTCSNVNHASSCPLSMALQSVIWDSYSPIAATCC